MDDHGENQGKIGERCVALFLFAILIFHPPLLSIFTVETFFAGLPLLYVYLFSAWCILVGLVALTTRRRSRPRADGAANTAAPASES